MIMVQDYQVDELLYESGQSRIYRGRRLRDGLPVVLNILNDEFPSVERQARLRQEFLLMQKARGYGVATAYGTETHQGKLMMVLEDCGGASLDRLEVAGALPLADWLTLAIRIVDCVEQLHGRHIMHKDLNPSNIVWNRHSARVMLIDLGISTELSRELPEIRNPERLEGTLPYLSPEQTGRMNRAIDYRTDFYSLGVTLYELLTGRLPFPGGDALELVHAHIAKIPATAHDINPRIPPVLSALIAKLMEKMAEERYQTAAGLKADLQRCLDTLDVQGDIADFELARHDCSGRLQIPQKLYGRETQLTALLTAFDRARQGPSELMLVNGYSGIGKSSLVHEIRKPVSECRGYFVEGKFDQFKRGIPYSALTQPFDELIRQLLTESDAQVRHWKEQVQKALGGNAQVIVDVVPDLELLVGPQAAVPALPPDQARNRFNHEFRKFVGVFAALAHPLVIFLDDLQWADLPSLQLMSWLLRPPALSHMLLIGAYRDNEIATPHPLPLILDEMEKLGAIMHSLTLAPLELGEVTRLLCDTLRSTCAETDALATLSLAKTQGNPFFLKQFLALLADKGMLHVDEAQGGWQWDIQTIQQAGVTDNIVELLVAKLRKLPDATQRVLQGAACLGNQFDLKTLAIVCDTDDNSAAMLLWEALVEELIIPLDGYYKQVGPSGRDGGASPTSSYRFQHDRIQQAAYSLVSAADKTAMHLAIGRLWLQSLSSADRHTSLFDLVNHFNLGLGLISDRDERLNLARLNLDVARRAKASAAHAPALGYLQAALELVAQEDWSACHELMLTLHLEMAEAAYLCFDPARMERHLGTALSHARDVLDRAKVYDIRIQACIADDRLDEAILHGLDILKLLGISFPHNPTPLHALVSLLQIKFALRRKSIAELEQLPDMTAPHILAASNILFKISPLTYAARPMYVPLILARLIRLSQQFGHFTAAIYAGYGMVLTSILGDIEQGAQYGDLALRLAERRAADTMDSNRTVFVTRYLIGPWKIPLHRILEGLRQDYLDCLSSGDVECAANAAWGHVSYSFYRGLELAELEKISVDYLKGVTELRQRPSLLNVQKIGLQLVLNLMGPSADPQSIQGDACDEQSLQEIEHMIDDQILMFQLWYSRMYLAYLFRHHHQALTYATTLARYASNQTGNYGCSQLCFYDSLARLALLDETRGLARYGMLLKVKKNQRKLRHWAKHNPANFLNKWMLVEAELGRRTRQPLKAIDCYEQAIKLAADNGFVQEEALAQELAGEFYLQRGQDKLARFHLREARQSYQRWGAMSKVNDLACRYPCWLHSTDVLAAPAAQAGGTAALGHTGPAGTLDFAAIMKASQALSQEIVLERLLQHLLQVVIENAGAQRGMVLLKQNEQWFLEAAQTDGEALATVLQSELVDDSPRAAQLLPLSLVRYVSNTRQSVVIDDATEAKLVARDPYVLARRPRSLLMLPILHQRGLTGLLYLENNALPGAFTEHRLQVLQLLASQTAISIENARLYASMEERVVARTADLTRFLAVASHDLRQPMHALNLYLGALANCELPEQARPILAHVRQCTHILDDMFLALLDISRLDASVVLPHLEVFPIASLLTQVHVEFEPQARARGLRLRVAPCSAFVHSDITLLDRILRNLVSNAVRYTEHGTILVGCRRQGRFLRVAVYDTGIGVAPEQQHAIFEEFYQADAGGRDRANGLGLGLAIVRRLGRLLSTPLTLVSKPGLGSMFAIDLPCVPPPQTLIAQGVVPSRVPTELSGRLVVVIDDEKSILDAMRTLLQQWGCVVLTSTSGLDAIRQLAATPQVPDALICDYRLLDGETGLDVVQALHTEFNQTIPALFITGDTAPELLKEDLASGLPVLHKPIQAAMLREALEQMLIAATADAQAIESDPP